MVAACAAEEDREDITPTGAFYRVKDAVEDGNAQDVIDGFTERGRKFLASHCLLEAIWERIRQPSLGPVEEIARLTDTEPLDLWPGEMRGGVDVLRRHGLDDEWQASFIDSMLGVDVDD
jgi:hypothetical protein